MPIRNIIFDWSGTLVNDLPSVLAATNECFRRAGKPPLTESRFRDEFELPFENAYLRWLPGVAISDLSHWFLEYWQLHQPEVPELAHAREFLEYCRKSGANCVLLSAVPEHHFRAQARVNGLDQYFQKTFLGVRNKVAQVPQILDQMKWVPDETVMIGDMVHDLDAARGSLLSSVAVLTGYQSLEKLRPAKPNLIVEHLGELQRQWERHGFGNLEPSASLAPASKPMPVATVGALIERVDERYLMVRTHKWSGKWGIPGGKIELGETCEAALRREILEETGLSLSEIRWVMIQDCIRPSEFYREAHFLLLNYWAKTECLTEVRLNHEAQEYRWVTASEMATLDLNLPTQRLWQSYQAQSKLQGEPKQEFQPKGGLG